MAFSGALDLVRNLLSWGPRRAAGGAPTPTRPRPTPGDARDHAYRTVEKIRTAYLAGRFHLLPWLDVLTEETPEIRGHYRIMLREPTLKAALQTKVLAVAAQEIQVHPDDETDPRQQRVAELIPKALKKLHGGPRHLAWSVLSGAVVDGWSLSEIVLRQQPERKGPFAGKVLWERVKAKDTTHLQLVTDRYWNIVGVRAPRFNPGHVFEGADLESFLIFSHLSFFENPIGQSDFRSAYRAYWIKDATWKLRALHLDRHTTPAMMGTYADMAQKEALEDALEAFKASTWLTVPTGALVQAIDIAGRGTADYEAAIKDCDREMLVGVVGAYLHILEGQVTDARGDTSIHKETSELLQWMLSAALGDEVSRQLIAPWVRLNYHDVEPPTITWGAVSEQAMEVRARVDKALQEIGLDLSKKEAYAYYGRQRPTDPNDVLQKGGAGGGPGGPPAGPGGPPGAGGMPGPGGPDQGPPGGPGAAPDAGGIDIGSFGETDGWHAFAEALAFTGEFKDSLGRRRCYQDGKPVACQQIAPLMQKGGGRAAALAAKAAYDSSRAPSRAGPPPQRAAARTAPAAAPSREPGAGSGSADRVVFKMDSSLHPQAQRHLKTFAGAVAANKVLTPVQKHEYMTCAQSVLRHMPPKALQRFGAHLRGVQVYSSTRALGQVMLRAMRKHRAADMDSHLLQAVQNGNAEIGGAVVPRPGAKFDLHLDGGHSEQIQRQGATVEVRTPTGIYGHEFAHVVDGPKQELSHSREWTAAFEDELGDGQLNNYAATALAEGFAEFGRLLYAGEHDLADIQAFFPRCYAFWEKEGLVPTPTAVPDPLSPDALTARVQTLRKALSGKRGLPPSLIHDFKRQRFEKTIARLPTLPAGQAAAVAKQLQTELDWASVQTGDYDAPAKGTGRSAVAPLDDKPAAPDTRAKVRPHLEKLLGAAQKTFLAAGAQGDFDPLVSRARALVRELGKEGVTNKQINRALAVFESGVEMRRAKLPGAEAPVTFAEEADDFWDALDAALQRALADEDPDAGPSGSFLDDIFGDRVELPDGGHADILLPPDEGKGEDFAEDAPCACGQDPCTCPHKPWEAGEKTDKIGRRYCWEDKTGKRVKCPPRSDSTKKDTSEGAAAPETASPSGAATPAAPSQAPSAAQAPAKAPAAPKAPTAKAQRQQSAASVQEALARVTGGGDVSHEDLQALADGFGHLTVPQLREARQKLDASFGGAKTKEPMIAALRSHVQGMMAQPAEGQDAKPEQPAPEAKAPEAAPAPAAPQPAARPPESAQVAESLGKIESSIEQLKAGQGEAWDLARRIDVGDKEDYDALARRLGLPEGDNAFVDGTDHVEEYLKAQAEGRAPQYSGTFAKAWEEERSAQGKDHEYQPVVSSIPDELRDAPAQSVASAAIAAAQDHGAIAGGGKRAQTLQAAVSALANVDHAVNGDLIRDGTFGKYGIHDNAYFRGIESAVTTYEREKAQGQPGAADRFRRSLETTRHSISAKLVPALRAMASDGVKGGKVDTATAADFYQSYGLGLIDALHRETAAPGGEAKATQAPPAPAPPPGGGLDLADAPEGPDATRDWARKPLSQSGREHAAEMRSYGASDRFAELVGKSVSNPDREHNQGNGLIDSSAVDKLRGFLVNNTEGRRESLKDVMSSVSSAAGNTVMYPDEESAAEAQRLIGETLKRNDYSDDEVKELLQSRPSVLQTRRVPKKDGSGYEYVYHPQLEETRPVLAQFLRDRVGARVEGKEAKSAEPKSVGGTDDDAAKAAPAAPAPATTAPAPAKARAPARARARAPRAAKQAAAAAPPGSAAAWAQAPLSGHARAVAGHAQEQGASATFAHMLGRSVTNPDREQAQAGGLIDGSAATKLSGLLVRNSNGQRDELADVLTTSENAGQRSFYPDDATHAEAHRLVGELLRRNNYSDQEVKHALDAGAMAQVRRVPKRGGGYEYVYHGSLDQNMPAIAKFLRDRVGARPEGTTPRPAKQPTRGRPNTAPARPPEPAPAAVDEGDVVFDDAPTPPRTSTRAAQPTAAAPAPKSPADVEHESKVQAIKDWAKAPLTPAGQQGVQEMKAHGASHAFATLFGKSVTSPHAGHNRAGGLIDGSAAMKLSGLLSRNQGEERDSLKDFLRVAHSQAGNTGAYPDKASAAEAQRLIASALTRNNYTDDEVQQALEAGEIPGAERVPKKGGGYEYTYHPELERRAPAMAAFLRDRVGARPGGSS